MQFHVEVLALPFVDAASAILCAAILLLRNCSWCRFLLWVRCGLWGMSMYEQHLLLLLLFFLLFFLLRAADAISCGGACSAICGCCFCNSMCCLSCSCAFKLQLVPVPALGFVRAVGCEQHLLLRLVLLLLPFLLEGC